jgi:DNA-binding winged helix-turn-helix (wHTH) protein
MGMQSDLQIDIAARHIRCGEKYVVLPPKVLAVLSYLVDRRGQIIPSAKLQTAIWGATPLSRGVLKTTIHKLRVALRSLQTTWVIESIPGQGYQLQDTSDIREAFYPPP